MFKNFDSPAQGVGAPHEVRTGRRHDDGRHDATGSGARHSRVRRLDRSHRARRDSRRRRRRVRRASSATSSSRSGTGPIRRLICTTKSPPTSATPRLNANGLIYGSPEESRDALPVLDPVTQHDQLGESAVSRCEYARPAEAARSRRRSGATSPSGIATSRFTIRCSTTTGRLWFTSRLRATGQSGVVQGRIEPSFGEDHSGGALRAASWRSTIRRPRRCTLIDTCFATHHLLFAEDANNTLWTSSGGGGGVVGWLNTKDVGPDARRAEVAGLDGAGARYQRQRQARSPMKMSIRMSPPRRPAKAWAAPSRCRRSHRSQEGHAPQRRILWPGDRHGWIDLGQRAGIPGRDGAR